MNSSEYPQSYAHHAKVSWALETVHTIKIRVCVFALFEFGHQQVSDPMFLIGKSCGNRGRSDSELDRGREAVTFYAPNAQTRTIWGRNHEDC